MTNEQREKQKWLERLKQAEKLAKQYSEIYEKKKEIANSAKKTFKNCPTSSNKKFAEMKIADMLDAKNHMDKQYEEAEKINEEVYKAVYSLPDKQLANILNARYIMFQTQENTAVMLFGKNGSVKTVERLHKKALDMLEIDGS